MPSSSKTLPVLRQCQACFHTSDKLSTCTGCRKAHYCSPECQREDWKSHKTECRINSDTRSRIKADSKAGSSGITPQLDLRKLESDLKTWSKTQRLILSWAVMQGLKLRTHPSNATSRCLYLTLKPNASANPMHRFSVEEILILSFENVHTITEGNPLLRSGFETAVRRARETAVEHPRSLVPIVIFKSGPIMHMAPLGVEVPQDVKEDDDWQATFKRAVLGKL